MKVCCCCSVAKPLAEFSKQSKSKDGLQHRCKDCFRAYRLEHREHLQRVSHEWYSNNKERSADHVRRWRRENPEAQLALQRAYQDANREKVRQWVRESYHRNREQELLRNRAKYERDKEKLRATRAAWQKANPEKCKVYCSRHRAYRLNAPGDPLTPAQWQEILETFNFCCAYCLNPLVVAEQEHMLPLSRGGAHSADNVVPACRSCNARKHDKTLLEYAAVATAA